MIIASEPVVVVHAGHDPALPMMFGPNITGSVNSSYAVFSGASSALTTEFLRTDAYTSVEKRTFDATRGFGIYASRASAIYGGSSSVQPSSLAAFPCIKS